jgi:hypothetical protein
MGSELKAVSDAEKNPEPARHTMTQTTSAVTADTWRSAGSRFGVVVHFVES